jgi:hypothetical protein
MEKLSFLPADSVQPAGISEMGVAARHRQQWIAGRQADQRMDG